DDTIVDFSSSAEPAWRAVCAQAAVDVAGLDAEALFDAIRQTRGWVWSGPGGHRGGRAALRAASRSLLQHPPAALSRPGPARDLPDLARRIAEQYRDRRERALRLFPGAVDALQRWRDAGTRLGLVTNGTGPDQRLKIARFALAGHFDHILIEGEFG